MQQFGAPMFYKVVLWQKLVRWKMSTSYIILSFWPYLCQKLWKLV